MPGGWSRHGASAVRFGPEEEESTSVKLEAGLEKKAHLDGYEAGLSPRGHGEGRFEEGAEGRHEATTDLDEQKTDWSRGVRRSNNERVA